MTMRRVDLPERWANVPGYDGKYQASTHGNIRRVNGNGSYLVLKPFTRKSSENRYVYKVWMNTPDGVRRERAVLTVVSESWRPAPPGYIVIHKNGVLSENGVENIRFVRRAELPNIYAHQGRRRPVCKLDGEGNVIECYCSAKQAAEENYMDLSTMCKHLNGKITRPLTTDGICFCWEEQGPKGDTHGRRKKV